MKETTINGKTYIPVFHETVLYGEDKCKDCIAKRYRIASDLTNFAKKLCISLPDCFDHKANISCHFEENYETNRRSYRFILVDI